MVINGALHLKLVVKRITVQIRLGADVQKTCYKKLKNLGLLINQDLTWDDQVNKICRNVSYTLIRLWPMADFTPIETRRKLVTSLIGPQFLYCDIIFYKTSMKLRERLKLAFNSCARYIYSISRFRHISSFANRILGVPPDTYYNFQMCCAVICLTCFSLVSQSAYSILSRLFTGQIPGLRRFLFRVQYCERSSTALYAFSVNLEAKT
jgi:hypothetical protein